MTRLNDYAETKGCTDDLEIAISKLKNGRVLVIGDSMLDSNCIGDAERISPEAPVPVVLIEKIVNTLGGAGNVARNIQALGAEARLISLIGNDYEGNLLRDLLQKDAIKADLLTADDRPTIVKTRVFARNQHMLRLDREKIAPLPQHLKDKLQSLLQKHLVDVNCIILSDYGKGFLYKELIQDIKDTAAGMGIPEPLILIDPKPKNKAYYQNAFLLTPNAKESAELANMPMSSTEEILAAGKTLRTALNANFLLTTLGAQGMALFEPDGSVWHAKTAARQVFDVSGAGDTVIATIAAALSAGIDIKNACRLANTAAGIVVGKVGAATASPEEILNAAETPVLERWA